jgi:hypothetical protein
MWASQDASIDNSLVCQGHLEGTHQLFPAVRSWLVNSSQCQEEGESDTRTDTCTRLLVESAQLTCQVECQARPGAEGMISGCDGLWALAVPAAGYCQEWHMSGVAEAASAVLQTAYAIGHPDPALPDAPVSSFTVSFGSSRALRRHLAGWLALTGRDVSRKEEGRVEDGQCKSLQLDVQPLPRASLRKPDGNEGLVLSKSCVLRFLAAHGKGEDRAMGTTADQRQQHKVNKHNNKVTTTRTTPTTCMASPCAQTFDLAIHTRGVGEREERDGREGCIHGRRA